MISNYNKLSFYISLIISISIVILLSNNILANTTNISETEYNDHNYLRSLCNNSVINCLDILLHIQKQKDDTDMNLDSIIDKVNSTKLKNWVDILSSFHTRHTKSNNLENVVYWLNSELQKVCKDNQVFLQNYTKIDQNQTVHLKNLICKKQSITGTTNNNTIIIGAHYDSRAANLNNTKVRAPGADDNASGVSGLLELARILSPFNLNYNIEFVLFSGEEQGKWGSNYYVRGLKDSQNNNNNINIDLYLNLDMIGYPPSSNQTKQVIIEYDVGNRNLQNDKNSKRIALLIQQITSSYTGLEAILNKLGNSDFIPFEALGYTVIGIHDEGEKFNPNYHKSSDTANSLNIEYLSSITKMVLATILTLDELNKYMH